jgi:hypothetical protein
MDGMLKLFRAVAPERPPRETLLFEETGSFDYRVLVPMAIRSKPHIFAEKIGAAMPPVVFEAQERRTMSIEGRKCHQIYVRIKGANAGWLFEMVPDSLRQGAPRRCLERLPSTRDFDLRTPSPTSCDANRDSVQRRHFCYRVLIRIVVKRDADENSASTGQIIEPGDIIDVTERQLAANGQIYARLVSRIPKQPCSV